MCIRDSPGGEQSREAHLMTRWLLLAFENYFQTKNQNQFYESLSDEQKARLNNEFPEDRKRMLREMWEDKFGQKL